MLIYSNINSYLYFGGFSFIREKTLFDLVEVEVDYLRKFLPKL